MSIPDQIYKTVIDASADKVWQAITNPEFTKQYWFGSVNISDWKTGSDWRHENAENGSVHHLGIVEDVVINKRLVLSWGNPGDSHDISRVTFDIVETGQGVELTITHSGFVDDSKMADRVSKGWSKVLSGMKDFLERGAIDMNRTKAC